jgi:LysM domain
MAAVLQLEPRFPDDFGFASPGEPVRRLRLIEPNRQPRPRPARRHQRAVYRRRRVLAALVGLGLVLTIARAGTALGGSALATPERLPHVQTVVVQPGDTLWSIAQRAVPGHDVRPVVDAMARALGTTTVVAGELVSVPTP